MLRYEDTKVKVSLQKTQIYIQYVEIKYTVYAKNHTEEGGVG